MRGCKMQDFISFLVVVIFFENFACKPLTVPNFEHFSLGDVDTLTIKIQKLKFFGRMRGPLNLKFANHFIIYQKLPFEGDVLGLAGYTQSSGPGELICF